MWKTVKLGDICLVTDYVANGSFKSLSENVKYLTGDGYAILVRLTDFTKGWNGNYKYVDKAAYNFLAKTKLFHGDLLISNVGEPGKTFLVPELGKPMTLAPNSILVRPDSDILNTGYLKYFIDSSFGKACIKGIESGTTQRKFNKTGFRNLEISLPPLVEQQRIVAKLDAAFAEIDRATSSSQPPLSRLIESFFEQIIFSSDATASWGKTTVENVLHSSKGSMRTGPFGSQLLKREFVSDGIRVLGIDNVVSNNFKWGKERFITEEKYKELVKYQVKAGDVLITIMGTCGRCVVVPSDIPVAINTKHICCITLDTEKCLPEFLRLCFLYSPEALDYLYAEAKGAVMPGLNMRIIKSLPLSIPPVEEQLEIITKAKSFFVNINKSEKLYKSKCDELVTLKSAILAQELQSEAA